MDLSLQCDLFSAAIDSRGRRRVRAKWWWLHSTRRPKKTRVMIVKPGSSALGPDRAPILRSLGLYV